MTSNETRTQIVNMVKDFVKRDVEPIAAEMDKNDEVPFELIDTMKELGLFGITVPEEYGGMGLDYTTFAMIFEELSKGFMSISGVIGTHHILTYVLTHFGTEEQKKQFLPDLASGVKRGGLALTEPGGGTDVASLKTKAEKDGEEYVVNGSKMFITNARHGDMFCLLARTDPDPESKHRGLTAFVMEKGEGFRVGRDLDKLGYRGLDTCEIFFDNLRVPEENVIGRIEGKGFSQVMSGLETGRINVAARAVGVSQAAFDFALQYSKEREQFGKPICEHQAIRMKLSEMAVELEAARQLVYYAASMKDSGKRCDLEAGMAKVKAAKAVEFITREAMQILGGYGYSKEFPVERYWRDGRVISIFEGTSEIQHEVIAKAILK